MLNLTLEEYREKDISNIFLAFIEEPATQEQVSFILKKKPALYNHYYQVFLELKNMFNYNDQNLSKVEKLILKAKAINYITNSNFFCSKHASILLKHNHKFYNLSTKSEINYDIQVIKKIEPLSNFYNSDDYDFIVSPQNTIEITFVSLDPINKFEEDCLS